jgi:L-rhamnose-H+ transport protein
MWTGLGVILVAGAIGGSVMAPIKYMTRWPFLNSWAVYSVWAYAILPWAVGLATIPGLFSIYPQVGSKALLICALGGLAWGLAVVLGALSLHWIGLALSGAILMGGSIGVGSLGPLLLEHPEVILTRQGAWILAVNAVLIVGVAICALAGHRRDKLKPAGEVERLMSPDPRRFVKGLTATGVAAILSTGFNIALTYSDEFQRLAIANGARPFNASNALWAYTVSFGFLPNIVMTLYRLTKEKLWGAFANARGPVYWIVPLLMGLMWFGGTALYGAGAGMLGPLGPVVGWPVYMAALILGGNFWGWRTGEWSLCPRSVFRLEMIGVAVIIAGIALLSATNG